MKLTMEEQELHDDFVTSVFQRGYTKGYEEGKGQTWREEILKVESEMYAKGLKDAWEYTRQIILSINDGGMSCIKFREIFDATSSYDVIAKYTINEVMDKIKAYDDTHDFKVGDEIVFEKNGIYREGKTGVIYKVLYDSEDNIYYLIRFPDGTFATHDGSNIKKTGKTYPYSPY